MDFFFAFCVTHIVWSLILLVLCMYPQAGWERLRSAWAFHTRSIIADDTAIVLDEDVSLHHFMALA